MHPKIKEYLDRAAKHLDTMSPEELYAYYEKAEKEFLSKPKEYRESMARLEQFILRRGDAEKDPL